MQIKTIQNGFFLGLVLLVTLAFYEIIEVFLQPVFWAAVLAIIFHPLQRRLLEWVDGREALASVLNILAIVFIVILPLFLIGMAVVEEATDLYARIASGEINLQEPIEYMERALPMANELFARYDIEVEQIQQGLSDAAVAASRYIASQALNIGQNALRITALSFLMLYVLFFFLRDGNRILEAVIRALPLGDERERRLFARFAEVSRATVKGTLVVGIVQGALGGFLFWILGIGAAVFWGVIMTVLSLLPAVGSALVWLPAAIILLVTGEVVKGIILIVAGTLVIGLVDNILRPILVGRDARMPDYLILLSTLGGLVLFGISGFVIGPIVAALFLTVWSMFEEEFTVEEDVEDVLAAAKDPHGEEAREAEAVRHPEEEEEAPPAST